jgi:hypothetical protein
MVLTMIKNFIKKSVRTCGFDIHRAKHSEFADDFNEQHISIIKSVKPYTMTSPERIFALIESVKYVVNNNIPGDIVECGVWKGGSMMAVAETLMSMNFKDKQLFLFDTFEGMSKPTDLDVSVSNESASEEFKRKKINDESSEWCKALLDEVQKNIFRTGYDKNKIHFIKGKVENTIPSKEPRTISILRLDTDWYESTKHELTHFFPRLSRGGVIIIDDYGWWQGAKKAVDEYFSKNKIPILLNRIDGTGRIAIKISE